MTTAVRSVILAMLATCGSCLLWTNRHCVVEGTAIDTPRGRVAVELLKVGDMVISRSPEGALRAGRVTAIHVGRVSEVTVIHAGSGVRLETSTQHLVATSRGWVAASDVGVGCELLTRDGVVMSVRVERVAKQARVVDLSVTPDQNYFADGILVHNKSVKLRTVSVSNMHLFWRKAADKGDAEAMYNIGHLYEKGHGVEQDYIEAMRWFRKAADKGNAEAMFNIGVLYERGRGVKQDEIEAMRWYRKAAADGDSSARAALARLRNK